MEFEQLELFPGKDKQGVPENFSPLCMRRGELYTIVGSTGSGKSRLIKDIEQLSNGDSITGRTVRLNKTALCGHARLEASRALVAHLGQNMRFILDLDAASFLRLHARCRNASCTPETVLALANNLTPEPISMQQNLNLLSGGQTRALMIADIALICDAPVVLVDEIENAGLDKEAALKALQRRDKLVLVVTHDPHTALSSKQRIVMQNGAVRAVIARSSAEEELYKALSTAYLREQRLRCMLRSGQRLSACET